MTGTHLIRCPACGQLSYDPRDTVCDNDDCRYHATCAECGVTIDPVDYRADDEGFCSATCHGNALAAANAEGFGEDGGL